MTEDEAKTKWCPMFRVGFHPEYQHNRIHDGKCGNCIASDCMMWRTETSTNCSTGKTSVCGGYCGLGGNHG